MIWRKLFGKKTPKEEGPHTLPLAPDRLFFNNLIMKHRCENKPVVDLLWSPNTTGGIRGHLISHIERGELQPCNITIVYNTYDLPDSIAEWRKETKTQINKKIITFIEGRGIKTPFSPEVTILIDGTDTPSQKLQTNEFLTIITPHIIHKTQSKPIFHVYFTENNKKQLLGYYFEGQQSLTIGNHWLDTYTVPSLPTVLFYHLKRTSDGFEHIQNSKLQMLKKEIDQSTNIVFFDASGTEKFSISLTPYQPPTPSPHPEVKTFHPPESKVEQKPKSKQFHIVMRGLLLQKIHFSKFIEGYYVYIEKTGELSFYSNNPVGQFWVSNHKIEFTANRINFKINGEPIQPKETILLTEETKIEYHRLLFQFYDHRQKDIENWPYLAEISYRGRKIPLKSGNLHLIGRQPNCSVNLPSSKKNDNIKWLPQFEELPSIPTRNGMVPKSSFSSDTILVASQHAKIDLRANFQSIQNISKNCFVFLYTNNSYKQLHPKSQPHPFLHHDRIYLGNHVFEFLISNPITSTSKISATDFVDNAGIFIEPINSPNRKKWANDTENALSAYFDVPKGSVNPNAPTVIDKD